MFYVWLSIVVSLAIIELSTVNLVSVWFVISGSITMVVSLLTDNITIQIAVFVLLGTLLMISTRKIVKKIAPKKEKTNIDRIVDMEGQVISKITKTHPGEVKVDGKIWTATADNTIEKDSIVKILEINSTKLKVKRMEEK